MPENVPDMKMPLSMTFASSVA